MRKQKLLYLTLLQVFMLAQFKVKDTQITYSFAFLG